MTPTDVEGQSATFLMIDALEASETGPSGAAALLTYSAALCLCSQLEGGRARASATLLAKFLVEQVAQMLADDDHG